MPTNFPKASGASLIIFNPRHKKTKNMNYINYSHANATNFSLQHITPFNLNETPIKNISHLLSKPSIETDCPIQYISRLEPDSKKYSTCNPDENLSLQDRVNSMFWKDQLSIAPPRPKKSNPIQKEKAENWINAHCPSQRETARKFLSVTRHITQEEFENSLKSSGYINHIKPPTFHN